MTDELFAAAAPKPIWLVTLADLALLLVGFLVLVQATANRDALTRSLRSRFGSPTEATVPVAATAADFAPNSAALARSAPLVAWARDALADPRVSVTVTGFAGVDETDGVLLAADRARTVAAALLAAGLPPERLSVATTRVPARRATLTLAFAGDPRSQP